MTGPSEAAVEAAAEAMWRRDGFTHWADDLPDVGQAVYAANARAALSAALPIIREELAAQVIKDGPVYNWELNWDGTEDPIRAAYVEAFRDASSIVRGEGA